MWLACWCTLPFTGCQVIKAYDIFMAFEGNIYCWHIFCSGMVNKHCSVVIFGGYGH